MTIKWFPILLFAVCIQALPVYAAILLIQGVVVRQVHGCEVDGPCSVVIQTDNGEKTVIWNQGESEPSPGCRPGEAAEQASRLQPGDHVQIHLPAACNGMLAGGGAEVIKLQ